MSEKLLFKERAIAALDPIHDRLVQFAAENSGLPKIEMAVELERKFGDELVKYFCIPLKMSFGSCLLAAMAVGSGNPIDIGEFIEKA